MTPISRRDVLAGLAASGAASIVTARSEQRQSSARQQRGAPLRRRAPSTRRCTPPLFRSECAAATAGSRRNPEVSQHCAESARQNLFNSTLGLGHALDQPGTFSTCRAATRRVAQAKALRARLRKPLELSRTRLTGWANSNHDDRRQPGPLPNRGQERERREIRPSLSSVNSGCSPAISAEMRIGWSHISIRFCVSTIPG